MNIPHVQRPHEPKTCPNQNHFISVLLDGKCPSCHSRAYFSIK